MAHAKSSDPATLPKFGTRTGDTLQIWACHLTNVQKLSKLFVSFMSIQLLEKSRNMKSISALVQEL